MNARAQTAWGAGALFLAVVAAVFLVAIAPSLEPGSTFSARVLFAELGGLREGAPVRSAGAEIGHVRAISWLPSAQAGADQATVAVELRLSRDQRRRTWQLGSAVVSSRGVLSARYLELLPPRGDPGPPLGDGDVLRGVDPPVLDRALARAWNNLSLSRQLAQEVAPLGRQLVTEVSTLVETLRSIEGAAPLGPALTELSAEAKEAWREVLAEGDVVGEGARVVARARRLAQAAEASLAELGGSLDRAVVVSEAARGRLVERAPVEKLAVAWAKAQALAPKLERVRTNVVALWERWQRKEGTLGRLLTDPEFPEDAKELGKIIKRQPWRLFGRPKEEVEAAR